MIIVTPSGGIKGGGGHGAFSPSRRLFAHSPLTQKKTITKISYIRRICGFLHLRIAFWPLDAPPQEEKNLVPPLATPSGGLIES